jgi:hypothetical protein
MPSGSDTLNMNQKTSYQFTLVLDGLSEWSDEILDALFEAGCGDALPVERDGLIYLDFDREAANPREAIATARAEIARANIGARVIRVEPEEAANG